MRFRRPRFAAAPSIEIRTVSSLAVSCRLRLKSSAARTVTKEMPSKAIFQTFFQRIKVTATVMVPFVVACVLLNCALWLLSYESQAPTWQWAVAGAAFYFAVWGMVAVMAAVRRWWRYRHHKPMKLMVSILALLICSPIAGALGGCLLRAYTLLLNQPQEFDNFEWLVMVFGSGVVMIVVLLAGIFHLGLVGRGSMDLVREWWARLGGYLMLITIGWLLLAGHVPLLRWACAGHFTNCRDGSRSPREFCGYSTTTLA